MFSLSLSLFPAREMHLLKRIKALIQARAEIGGQLWVGLRLDGVPAEFRQVKVPDKVHATRISVCWTARRVLSNLLTARSFERFPFRQAWFSVAPGS